MAKHKVAATVRISVDTWIEDDGKHDLKDQAYDQVKDLVSMCENTCPGEGDEIEISDIAIHSITETKQ